MPEYRMKVYGTGRGLFLTPMWLKAYDVNDHDGHGSAVLTLDPSKALTWPDLDTVLAVWKMQSTVRPVRADGKPNRPLSAYTIEPELVP